MTVQPATVTVCGHELETGATVHFNTDVNGHKQGERYRYTGNHNETTVTLESDNKVAQTATLDITLPTLERWFLAESVTIRNEYGEPYDPRENITAAPRLPVKREQKAEVAEQVLKDNRDTSSVSNPDVVPAVRSYFADKRDDVEQETEPEPETTFVTDDGTVVEGVPVETPDADDDVEAITPEDVSETEDEAEEVEAESKVEQTATVGMTPGR